MLKNTLLRYSNYNYWANDRLLSLINKEVESEKLDRKIDSSFPSLRKTIYHIWDAESIWLKRLNGESVNDWPSKSFSGDFENARSKMLRNSKAFVEYVENRSEEELSIPFTYSNVEGKSFSNPVWESVLHCFNHSTYHRGQVVTLLRQLKITNIPATDFIAFGRTANK
jgi:uncharacterized damage-inducible protein DinB